MKKTTLAVVFGLAVGSASLSAQSALTSGSLLAFDAGNVVPDYTGTNWGNYATAAEAGASWFGMGIYGPTTFVYTALQVGNDGGIRVGTAQGLPMGVISHNGNPYGATDIGAIDAGWSFLGNTGLHFTASATNIMSGGGNSGSTLDFSGWRVTWNGIPSISMGGGLQVLTDKNGATTYNNGSGLATITCSTSSCSNGSTFALDYSAVVAQQDPSGFSGVAYALHLTGHVQSAPVPIPAAVWLFGSGLVGLMGAVVRRRTQK